MTRYRKDSFYAQHVAPFEEDAWRAERDIEAADNRADIEAEERWLARGIEDDYDPDDTHVLADSRWRDLFDGVEQ